jgi:hypothetical protein
MYFPLSPLSKLEVYFKQILYNYLFHGVYPYWEKKYEALDDPKGDRCELKEVFFRNKNKIMELGMRTRNI